MRVFLLLAVLLCASPASGDSIVTLVTPANIAAQPLEFIVLSEAGSDGTLLIHVLVAARQDSVSPVRVGTLEIWNDKPPDLGDTSPNQSNEVAAVSCNVAAVQVAHRIAYDFVLRQDMVPRASFTYCNGEPHGMPSFDGYELRMSDFVSLRR
jgi:hypothetical protein